MLDAGRVVTVRDLLKGLYEKACQQKLWGLVRHSAGMLGKRVEDLAKAVTDLLVRQKQVSFYLPFVLLVVDLLLFMLSNIKYIIEIGHCWNASNKRIHYYGSIARNRASSIDPRSLW
jgi:hypothetical protein